EHVVGRLDMRFLHDGRPPIVRDAWHKSPAIRTLAAPRRPRYDDDLKMILGSLNVCSKEWVIRQYDHEVQAGSVVKPLVGVSCDGPSDAAIVRPDLKSNRGLVIANGMNPRYGDLDPYSMAASAIDEAVRNCVAVGADPSRIALLDNFCWGNTDRPETLGSLVRAALACRDVAIAFGTPFISGKDSLNNEFSFIDDAGRRQTVAIPPALLISALGQIEDIRRAVTMDVKEPGNLVALVGTTRDELGGSQFALVNGLEGGTAPQVDAQLAPRIFRALHQAIASGLVRSCHDLSEGGLAVAAAEMAFAGGLGIGIDLQALAERTGIPDDAVLLFSETNSRFLVEIAPADWPAFAENFSDLPLVEVGKVTGGENLMIRRGDECLIDAPWSELKRCWKAPLAWE
ncbi:MAG TPA: AIR synthase-related protein, partial [Planctomycetaceae bacterium]|nr:AIR synthase-related protein [Planctomycetaceae bacterium]